jgi:hypothetical protein
MLTTSTTVARILEAAAGAAADGPCALLMTLAGCTGLARQDPAPIAPRHQTDSTFVQMRAFHGVPILQKSFFWDGNGEVEDTGLGVHAGTYLDEQFAVGIGSNVATWWTPGSNVHSLELEGLLRLHPLADWPLFVDGTGGYQLATGQIPPGGTVWNFTFGFGLGLELPVGSSMSLLTAVDYHHISNALGRDNERNPSQNEARIWVGIEWNF